MQTRRNLMGKTTYHFTTIISMSAVTSSAGLLNAGATLEPNLNCTLGSCDGNLDDKGFHCGQGALVDPLGIFVQVVLAAIAFACLILKRFCEPKHERRSWKIWFFDTSKQAAGAGVIHFANVFLAGMFQGDPCTWYIMSFLLDSTIGLFIIYIGLKISLLIVINKGWKNLTFGEYGNPPSCNAWIGQCVIYIIVVLIEKILMTLLVLFHFWEDVRKFIMSPIKNPKLELVIVMFLVPFVVNAFIFWVVDNFLKRKTWTTSHSAINSNESAMRYFRAVDKVKYYERTEMADESESDNLLSLDEEPDTRYRRLDSMRSVDLEQQNLLGAALT